MPDTAFKPRWVKDEAEVTLAGWLIKANVAATQGFRRNAVRDVSALGLPVGTTCYVLVNYLDVLRVKKAVPPPQRPLFTEVDLIEFPIQPYYEKELELLIKSTGTLVVRSEPTGASVKVDDDQKSGQTPMTLAVRPGEHDVVVFKTLPSPPHLYCTQTVDVPKGKTKIVICRRDRKSA